MQYFEDIENQELMTESQNTLKRLNEKNKKKVSLLEQMTHDRDVFDKGKNLYEEYSEDTFNYKSKIDLLYYSQLLENLDSSLVDKVTKLLVTNIKNIKEIYESINTNPEYFGKANIPNDILEESIEFQHKVISKNIYEFLNTKFYKLNPKQREEKYLPLCIDDCKTLISEGLSPDEATQFNIKKYLISELLDSIAFPSIIKYRLNYLLESKSYGQLFDQDELKQLYTKYQDLNTDISKIVVMCI